MPGERHILIRLQDEHTWIPLREALAVLNMEKSLFYYYRDKPDGIRTRKGKNNRDKAYNLGDIKRLQAQREGLEITYEHGDENNIELKWVTPADLPAVLKLDYDVYAAYLMADANLYASWITKNKNIALCAFDKNNGRCLAYISVLPLTEETILQILTGKRNDTDITSEEILTYDHPGIYTLLIESAVSSEEKYLNRVLQGILQFWVDMYPERRIKHLYAKATSERGHTLLQKFYFSKLALVHDGTLLLLDTAYVLDLQRPAASKVFRQFQQVLEQKKQQSQE